MKRVGVFLTALAIGAFGLASPVLAAVPSNDLYAGRTVIPAVPFLDVIDTTEATTDADDAELNAQCGAPATDASVWYEYVHVAPDAVLHVGTFESDYLVGILVATGAPGSFALLGCNAVATSFPVLTGETYTILLFDYQGDGGGNGGMLGLRLEELPPPPPPPSLDVTIDPAGSFHPVTGSATIRGAVTCDGGGDEVHERQINLQVRQDVGRFRFEAWGDATFDCDGATHPWSVEVFSGNGKFAGGKALVVLHAFACNTGACSDVEASATVILRR